jgi:hypothetical protein
MKMGLQNYAAVMPIGRSCITCNNSKLSSIEMSLHNITELYTGWFSICPNATSEYCFIAIFKNFVKENNVKKNL